MVLKNVAGDLSVKISILILVVRKKMCDCQAPQQRHSKEHHIYSTDTDPPFYAEMAIMPRSVRRSSIFQEGGPEISA